MLCLCYFLSLLSSSSFLTILGAKSAEIGDTHSFLGLAFHNDGKADGRVYSAEVLSTSYKNLVNFGPLTPKFTLMVWRPFMRQMREIVETRSILETRIRQWVAGTAERICAKFTRKTCLSLRSDEFECQGQRSKVKVTRDKKCAVHSQHPAMWTKWNALVADNVAQAADATIRSLQRGVSSLGCVRWAWRATAGLCHAFIVSYTVLFFWLRGE